jgi:hypothetical protein
LLRRALACSHAQKNVFERRIALRSLQKRSEQCSSHAAVPVSRGYVDAENAPLMPFLQSCFSEEGRRADELGVRECSEVKAAFGHVAKAACCCFNRRQPVLFKRFPECERVVLEGFQPDLPPRCSIAFKKRAYCRVFGKFY